MLAVYVCFLFGFVVVAGLYWILGFDSWLTLWFTWGFAVFIGFVC